MSSARVSGALGVRFLWNNRAMSKRYFLSIAVIALVAAIAGIWVGNVLTRPAVIALESGTVFPAPRETSALRLIGSDNQAAAAMLTGAPTLVFFGFTHCPDVCPTTLALLAGVKKRAAVPGLKVALITVDPERDTPEPLARYVAAFGPQFIGLTGAAPDIVAAQKTFGVASSRVDLPGGNYTMDHSATVFALDSRARIVAIFTPPLKADAMARDLEKLAAVLRAGASS